MQSVAVEGRDPGLINVILASLHYAGRLRKTRLEMRSLICITEIYRVFTCVVFKFCILNAPNLNEKHYIIHILRNLNCKCRPRKHRKRSQTK